MSIRLVQLRAANNARMVGVTRGGETYRVKDATSIYALAQQAIGAKVSLERLIGQLGSAEPLNLAELLTQKQVLAPIEIGRAHV